MPDDKINVSRRDFLSKSGKVIGVCLCSSAAISFLESCEYYWEKPVATKGIVKEINIAEEPWLQLIGYGINKTYQGLNYNIPLIIVRLSEQRFICVSSMCTHESCFGKDMVMPLGDYDGFRDIVCNCHGSRFDPFQDAKPVKGPAEKPLKQFPTEFDSEKNILKIFF